MKKFISLLLALATVTALFGGCDKINGDETALVISGTEINREIYNYYYDRVQGRPGDYNLSDSPAEDEIRDAAIELCKHYVALNTSFALHKLTLSTADKVDISDKVNNHWIRFYNHYEKIGVSRQTLNKIFTDEAYEDSIFSAMYDKGTDNKDAEEQIKNYFYSEYTAFRSICAYFTKEDGTAIPETEKQAIVAEFNEIAENAGDTAETFTDACTAADYYASDVVVIKGDSDGYPTGFFDTVYDQTNNTVKVIEYGDCVFAVWKESIEDLGESVYAAYRSTLIKEMYSENWQSTINGLTDSFTVDEINV